MTKKTYNVLGMHCTSCPLVIESDLEDIGVKASCNYARATLDVEYDESCVTKETVEKVVTTAGYSLSED